MQIEASAGNFEVSVSQVKVEKNQVVMIGNMGVWEARIYASPRDIVHLLRLMITNLQVLALVMYLPFMRVFRPDVYSANSGSGEREQEM